MIKLRLRRYLRWVRLRILFFQERRATPRKIKTNLKAEGFFPWSQVRIAVVVCCLCVAFSAVFACWLWWFLWLWWLVFLFGFVCFVLFNPFSVGVVGPSCFALLGGGSFLAKVVCCFPSSLAMFSFVGSLVSCLLVVAFGAVVPSSFALLGGSLLVL